MKKLLLMILCLCFVCSCAIGQEEYTYQNYFDKNGNNIQIYYDPEYECWCQITIYGQLNEEGCTVVDFQKMSGEMINTIWWSDWENSVRAREYVYYASGALESVRYIHADGSNRVDAYAEDGALQYSDVTYADLNAEGYRVSQRFMADGTLDHEWWWGESNLYHEIWYLPDGSVDFSTYWYYGTPEADEIYEEYDGNGVMLKRYLFRYNENGELERIG